MNKILGRFRGLRDSLNCWQSERRIQFGRGGIHILAFAFASFSVVSFQAEAVTIISGPAFTPASNAPLAGVLQVATDVPTRVSVSISDGSNSWQRSFVDYTNAHSVTLAGFKPGRTNAITVTVWDRLRRNFTAIAPVQFVTASLPV